MRHTIRCTISTLDGEVLETEEIAYEPQEADPTHITYRRMSAVAEEAGDLALSGLRTIIARTVT